VTPLPGWASLGLLLLFAVLTFVPTRYLYPTQRGRLNSITNVLGGAWALLLIVILFRLPASPDGSDSGLPALIVLSLYFPVYYLAVSWTISWHLGRDAKRGNQQATMVEGREG
jgi:phosphatidylcholine synthase